MQSTTRFFKTPLWAVSLVAVAVLAACGGSPDPVKVASAATPAPIDKTTGPTVAAAVSGTTFTFPAVPSFGTTETTTVVVTSTSASATPTFSIGAGTKKASGNLGFGSCIFTITQSDFVAPSPLAVGQTITVNPCALSLDTTGKKADGSTSNTNTTMVLGTTSSASVPLPAAVSSNGTVTVNNQTVGTVTTTPTTGTGGG